MALWFVPPIAVPAGLVALGFVVALLRHSFGAQRQKSAFGLSPIVASRRDFCLVIERDARLFTNKGASWLQFGAQSKRLSAFAPT